MIGTLVPASPTFLKSVHQHTKKMTLPRYYIFTRVSSKFGSPALRMMISSASRLEALLLTDINFRSNALPQNEPGAVVGRLRSQLAKERRGFSISEFSASAGLMTAFICNATYHSFSCGTRNTIHLLRYMPIVAS